MQDVLGFRNRLIDEYAAFSRSFSRIAADDLAARVEQECARGRYWRAPHPGVMSQPSGARPLALAGVQAAARNGAQRAALGPAFLQGDASAGHAGELAPVQARHRPGLPRDACATPGPGT